MTKPFLIVFILLITGSVHFFSQNSTDSQGRKQGAWIKYHADGKTPRYKGQFKDDKPFGEFIYYYESGEVQTVLSYETDGSSIARTYFTNGNLMSKGSYINQLKDGPWWYFSTDKLVIAKENYKNGKLEGISYKFFPTEVGQNPAILEETNYINGVAQGAWTRYFQDGKTQVKGKYKDGLQTGECTWFSPSGKTEVVGYFKEGEKNGWWRFYDTEGNETKKFFVNGTELQGEMLEKYLKAQAMEKNK